MNWNLFAAALLLLFVGYTLVLPRLTAEKDDFNPALSAELVKEGALLLDVRSVAEFDSGHVEGAKNIPHTEISKRKEEIEALTKGDHTQTIVVYCASGRRSGIAKKTLQQLGYTRVVNHGGLSSWEK